MESYHIINIRDYEKEVWVSSSSSNRSSNLVNASATTGSQTVAGTATVQNATWYSIFGRIAASSTNSNPYFWLGASKNNPNTSLTFDISTANATVGTLQSYLAPYGAGGAFVVRGARTGDAGVVGGRAGAADGGAAPLLFCSP